jgi:ATP-dependent RNA helicase SUPV3L1/SUV3
MGPTNSGKTYNALKALSRAGTGVYAGPLRLLAHEVWERLNLGTVGELDGKGRACNLLTGEERRIVDTEAGLVACTVEMLPLAGVGGESWDTVVIDEIQMMGDSQRGGAWTNAIMGVNAKEIHLCGDETTAALLQSMIDSFKGDTLTIHRYDRLTPLSVSDKSLNSDWNKVQPGDCVVTFSRSNVFSVKKAIEGTLGKRCAVVYGALPPETRAEQAREFNEEAGRAEILVASDAVGMGLNL